MSSPFRPAYRDPLTGDTAIEEVLRADLRILRGDLDRYKKVVHQMSFEAEMRVSTSALNSMQGEVIRGATLMSAAEFLMEYGIPKDNEELVVVCDAIRALPMPLLIKLPLPPMPPSRLINKWDAP